MLNSIRRFIGIQTADVEFNRARFTAMSRMMPLMYGIIFINMLLMAVSHFKAAPVWATVYVPVAFSAIILYRNFKHMRTNIDDLSDDEVAKRLRETVRLSTPLGLLFTAWSTVFYGYGDQLQQAQAMFFTGVTVCAITLSLIHLRQAAVLLILSVVIPICTFWLMQNNIVYTTVAINTILVAGILFIVVEVHHKELLHMVDQQKRLRANHDQFERMSVAYEGLANTDSLTELPNRRALLTRLSDKIAHCEKEGKSFYFGVLDLDGFKAVNDVHGHVAGDELLMQVADRISHVLIEKSYLARLGGDEFAIIFPTAMSGSDVTRMAARVCLLLNEPFILQEGTAKVGATIGLAAFPDVGETAHTLYERADYALRYGKVHSPGHAVPFNSEHEEAIRSNSRIEHALKKADLEAELSMVFQPVLNLKDRSVLGFEALARWNSPQLGSVPPDQFIKVAEQCGMINQMTRILFQKTLDAANEWPDCVHISFNLSPISLSSMKATMALVSILERSRFSPSRLVFEITETAIMQNYDATIKSLDVLHNLGVRIALDDFGTGFSSLSHLQELPIDWVKIDRIFAQRMHADEKSDGILGAIANLCQNLGLHCVLEGVESEREATKANQLGIDLAQGYYFSRPMGLAAATAWLESKLSDGQSEDQLRA